MSQDLSGRIFIYYNRFSCRTKSYQRRTNTRCRQFQISVGVVPAIPPIGMYLVPFEESSKVSRGAIIGALLRYNSGL